MHFLTGRQIQGRRCGFCPCCVVLPVDALDHLLGDLTRIHSGREPGQPRCPGQGTHQEGDPAKEFVADPRRHVTAAATGATRPTGVG
ncbi:hypothetical protein ACGFR8_00430 [Streptomyces brevispora]|uniref:hypothetical protein n=1 Tax=Streptomyces brevispora TaxID=887462 RepID=UPI00371D21CC